MHDARIGIKQFYPLALILFYLLFGVIILNRASEHGDWMSWMTHFMGGFFLIFSFFKFLDLPGFADAYQTYDLIAGKSRTYALIYPFIELALGVSFLMRWNPAVTNAITLSVMGVSTIGVAKKVFGGKKIPCACLGTVFKIPMTSITLFEDLLMVGMSVVGLAVR